MRNYPMWLTLGILSGLLWGCNNYLYDMGTRYADIGAVPSDGILFPLVCTAINDMSAAVFLLIVHGCRGVLRSIKTLFNRSGFFLCAAALLGGPLGQLSYCLGIFWTGPTYALAISALYPVIGCILARIFLRQMMTLRMGIGIVLAVVGAIITSFTPTESSATLFFPGLICALFAAICWGSEIVLAVRGMKDIEPDLAITVRECISGTVLVLITLAVMPGASTLWKLSSAPMAFSTFVVAGAVAGGSYFLWYSVNRAIGCARGMATNATYIIWGVLLQWGIADVDVSRQVFFGCVLVFVGVLLVSLCPNERESTS